MLLTYIYIYIYTYIYIDIVPDVPDTFGESKNNIGPPSGGPKDCEQVIRVKNLWGLPPHALESLVKHWSVSAQLNIH